MSACTEWMPEEWRRAPIVPRPPMLKRPNRANGAEQVVIFGVTFRITITLAGSDGMSFEVMAALHRISHGIRSEL